jgi:hypothetical protein
MIRKHIDLIAIAVLLAVFGLCSQTRNAVVASLHASRSIGISHFKSYVTTPAPRIRFSLD